MRLGSALAGSPVPPAGVAVAGLGAGGVGRPGATLVTAPRLGTVMHADRVVVVEGGQIVQSGRHGELMATEGLYRPLVERQFVSA